ncbi:MAG: ATP-binding cassette domain-containing protein, partial [Chlamydiae bacterium]|nr:ATP-binding cassette domain-containing protein [Chlamydiota bacterium]
MIEITNLSKTFRSHRKAPGFWGSVRSLFWREWHIKQALSNIHLTIEQGEILGLLGANGAGKTTLVKILSGIIHP